MPVALVMSRRPYQLSIRHILLANLVIALWLAIFVCLGRLTAGKVPTWQLWGNGYLATVVTSSACWATCLVLLAPGARRDRILGGLLGGILLLVWAPLGVIGFLMLRSGGSPFSLRMLMSILSFNAILFTFSGLRDIARMAVPRRCLHCGERGLVDSLVKPGWKPGGARWCEICGTRWVRDKSHSWTDASAAEFDKLFWMDTVGQSIRKALQFRWR